MKKTKIFFINGIILTITSLFMKSIGMVFNLYVANKIGSEAVGIFGLVMSVYIFAITLATSGLSLACTCIVSEEFSNNNFFNGFKAIKSCFFFSLFISVGTSFLFLVFSQVISQYWLKSMVSNVPIHLIAVGLPFISISSVLSGYFSAVRKGYKSAISQIFELVVKIIISIILLNFYASQEVESICNCLILADIISEICSCCLLFFFYRLDKTTYCKRPINKITFKKRILKIIFPVSITSYLRSGLSTLKQFIIPNRLLLFGLPYSIALSEYGKISNMTMSVLMFPNVFILSFSNLLIPEFSSLMAKQYKKRILDISQKVFLVSSIFSLSISMILFFFSNEISILIFKNLSCAKYIKILSPLILFMYLDPIIDSMLKGLNRQVGVMICNILDLILTISILYFLLPFLGIRGYLISIIISETFNFCVSFYQLHSIINIKISIFLFLLCVFLIFLGFYEIITIM